MAKKVPKPPAGGASFPWTTSIAGVAGLLNRNPLTTGRITGTNPFSFGSSAWQARNMANMAKMGQVSMANTPGFWAKTHLLANRAVGGLGRFGLGRTLMHPGVMLPAAGTMLARYAVNKAWGDIKDPETGRIGAEGWAKLAMRQKANEDLVARIKAAREKGASTWELMKMKKDPSMLSEEALAPFLKAALARESESKAVPFHESYAKLKAKYPDRGPKKEDLWHKGLFWSNRAPEEKSAVTGFMDKFFNEGGIARLV